MSVSLYLLLVTPCIFSGKVSSILRTAFFTSSERHDQTRWRYWFNSPSACELGWYMMRITRAWKNRRILIKISVCVAVKITLWFSDYYTILFWKHLLRTGLSNHYKYGNEYGTQSLNKNLVWIGIIDCHLTHHQCILRQYICQD